eukprot:10511481-Lingulodinium_polyedra.AAC.1
MGATRPIDRDISLSSGIPRTWQNCCPKSRAPRTVQEDQRWPLAQRPTNTNVVHGHGHVWRFSANTVDNNKRTSQNAKPRQTPLTPQ